MAGGIVVIKRWVLYMMWNGKMSRTHVWHRAPSAKEIRGRRKKNGWTRFHYVEKEVVTLGSVPLNKTEVFRYTPKKQSKRKEQR